MSGVKRARISSIAEVAPNVFEVHAALEEPFAFEPGQYVAVHIPATKQHRHYSIASAPGAHELVLLVRRSGTGSTFLASLDVGAPVEFEGPRGEFRLAPATGDAVFGATGVGVSPLFPMMESLLAQPATGRVMLFWGLPTAADQFWRERLARLAADPRFSSRIVLESEGFVTQPIIATATVLRDPTYYICGNRQMVADVVDRLVALGVDRGERIRTDEI